MLAKIRRYPAILGRIILKYSNKLSTNRILQLHTMKSVCKTLCKTAVDSSQLIYITGYLLCTLVSITNIWAPSYRVALYSPKPRDYQGKRVHLPYRHYTQGNSSLVIFRHSTQSYVYDCRALRGRFLGGFVCVSLCGQSEGIPPTLWGCLLLNKYHKSKEAFTLAIF